VLNCKAILQASRVSNRLSESKIIKVQASVTETAVQAETPMALPFHFCLKHKC